MLNCLFFRIFSSVRKSGHGLLPANSIWQGAGGPATSQMRCWLLPNGRIFPAAAGLLCVGSAYCIRIFLCCPHGGATWGLYGTPARTLAAEAQSRTQRRHAPHGAAQALDLLAGSIGSIFSTVGKSALSARLSEIHRLPLLRYVSAKTPFSLRAATLSRTSRVTFLGVIPRLPSGSIFADSADGEPRYVESARSNSERSFVS